jgi:hypothetical protein
MIDHDLAKHYGVEFDTGKDDIRDLGNFNLSKLQSFDN